MSRLFGIAYKLIVDDIEIAGGVDAAGKVFGNDIAFKVEKSIKAEPNKATIQVYNLNPDHRGDLERRFGSEVPRAQRKPVHVELSAGYGDDIGIIFSADLRNLVNKREGVDWITQIEGADGGHSWKTRLVSRSFSVGVSVETVIRAAADALGVGKGNLDEQIAGARYFTQGATFADGTVLSGWARDEFDRLMRGCGFDWSIQGGVLQVKRRGEPIDTKVFELSPDSGLLEAPYAELDATVIPKKGNAAPSEDAIARAGLINFKCLMLHQLFPGQKVKLKSQRFEGGYQVVNLGFVGNTVSGEWHCDGKGRPY